MMKMRRFLSVYIFVSYGHPSEKNDFYTGLNTNCKHTLASLLSKSLAISSSDGRPPAVKSDDNEKVQ